MSFFRSEHSHSAVVIDIDSNSIGVGLVVLGKGVTPELIYPLRVEYSENGLKPALRRVLAELMKNGQPVLVEKNISRSVDHVLINLSSPYESPRAVSRKAEYAKATRFDEELAKSIVREEEENFWQVSNLSKEEHDIFQSEVTSLILNGYNVPFPTYKKALSWQVDIVQAVASKKFLKEIESEISTVLTPKRGFCVRGLGSTMFASLPASLKRGGPLMVASVSGEVIEVLFIESGRLMSVSVVPYGPNHVVRRLSQEFEIPFALAQSYLILFAKDVLLPELSHRIGQIVAEEEGVLADVWTQTQRPVTTSRIIINAPREYDAYIRILFKKLFPVASVVSVSDSKYFTAQVSTVGGVCEDESLAMLALYSNSLL
jgi:hypothetical protein